MKIGQLKKGDIDDYEYCKTADESYDFVTVTFGNNSFAAIKGNFKKGICYSLKDLHIGLRQSDIINIKLISSAEEDYIYQNIRSQNIQSGDNLIEELVFIPKMTFNYMIFETTYNMSGATPSISLEKIRIINNIKEKCVSENDYITSLGIQGVSGLKFVINGNLIQMGKSRIYSVSDIDINFIGFIIDDGDNDKDETIIPVPLNRTNNYFIMDYQYEEA